MGAPKFMERLMSVIRQEMLRECSEGNIQCFVLEWKPTLDHNKYGNPNKYCMLMMRNAAAGNSVFTGLLPLALV